ncbi:MAG: universal stress protein [Nitrososphaeraceae archaeon]
MSDKMRKFSKILVAVDGSEPSMLAANCAIDVAKKHNAQLIALTVSHIPLSSYGLGSRPDAIKHNKEKVMLEAKEWFQKLEEAGAKNNVLLKTELIDTQMSVEGTIVEYAESEGVDLIVIGTTGRSGFKKLLLGSVASGVVNYATCSVLVAK